MYGTTEPEDAYMNLLYIYQYIHKETWYQYINREVPFIPIGIPIIW